MPSPSYTIGSDVGDDFTTLGLALSDAGVRADATSTVELLLRNESHSDGTGVNTINDATFACNDLVIKPMAGAVQDGIIGSTAKPILVCDGFDTIRWKDNGTTLTVQDIEFDFNADQFNSNGTLAGDSTSAVLIQRCMFHNASNSTARYCIQTYVGSTNDVIRNCLFFNIVNTALTTNMLYSRGTGTLWQNLTAYADDSASSGGVLRLFRHQAGTSTVQNCVLSTSTASPTYVTPFSAVSTSSSNVSSQSGVTGVTQEAAATTFDSLTGTTPLRIKDGSAAVSAGTDLSGSFTDDLLANTRTGWDIGSIDYVSAVTTPKIAITAAGKAAYSAT